MNRVILGICATAVALLLATRYGAAENEADKASPFKGKILVITLRDHSEDGAILDDTSIQRLGNASFIVGTGVDYGDSGDWGRGRKTWIAIDDVSQIIEFDDLDQYKKAVNDSAAANDCQWRRKREPLSRRNGVWPAISRSRARDVPGRQDRGPVVRDGSRN